LHVGGFDDLSALNQSGKLDEMLNPWKNRVSKTATENHIQTSWERILYRQATTNVNDLNSLNER
jgi:hypothetical protein